MTSNIGAITSDHSCQSSDPGNYIEEKPRFTTMEPISFTVGVIGLASIFSIYLDIINKVDSYKEFCSEL